MTPDKKIIFFDFSGPDRNIDQESFKKVVRNVPTFGNPSVEAKPHIILYENIWC